MEKQLNQHLAVCIPTYKRPDQLHRCVKSVIAAAAPYRVPIVIADDSTDDTNRDVIADVRSRYTGIIYERNTHNLGIDRNIVRSVDLCPCDYAWIMGEDDRMLPDAIRTLLDTIENAAEPPAFVCVNYAYVDHEIAHVLRESILPDQCDTVVPVEEFLKSRVWAIGFIGGCVVNRSLWGAVDRERYVGTFFAHVGAILESLAGRTVTIVARPQILNRIGSAEVVTWSADTYNVFDGWEAMTRLLEPIYGAELCQQAAAAFRAGTGYGSLRFLCSRRADRIYDLERYRQMYQGDRRPAAPNPLLAQLIACAPPPIFQAARAFKERRSQRYARKISDFERAFD
jgi:glycosyltransferase involved in cell wall biosynthesis